MSLYRKKPVVIEAVQLRWDTWSEMCDHLGKEFFSFGGKAFRDENTEAICLDIFTLEGVMHATQDDWIIRGVKGELYPCKPDIFEATYERATVGSGGQESDCASKQNEQDAALAEPEQ